MSEFDNEEVLVQDELAALKARADMLGISYHPSIGLDKLRNKVNSQSVEDEPDEPEKVTTSKSVKPAVETEGQIRVRKKREASELVRIRVQCMNPAKKEWDGEIFTVGNAIVGSYKKYIPFAADEGWHVPRIIYQHIKERQCQVFTAVKDSRGNTTRKGKLIKEFAVEVMEPLTQVELDEMARRQAMAKAID